MAGTLLIRLGPVAMTVLLGIATASIAYFSSSHFPAAQPALWSIAVIVFAWHFVLIVMVRPWWIHLLYAAVHLTIFTNVWFASMVIIGGAK